MKLVKMMNGFTVPPLWLFMQEHLPPSLLAIKMDDGYGEVFGVKVKANTVAARLPVIEWFQDRIATVWHDRVELMHPQYFSDFEAVIQQYEAEYGKEVEFRYWEAK